MAGTSDHTIHFDDYLMDLDAGELRRAGEVVAVEPQVFDLIRYLAEHSGRLVTRDDLLEHVWGGRIVSDAAISTRINAARRALDDDGKRQRVIKTVTRRGFRFLPKTTEESAEVRTGDHETRSVNGGVNSARHTVPDKPSIAVLPFTNLSGDAEQEYFSDGISEDIIEAFARLHWLFVIGRNSAFAYKGASQDVRHVGSDLGVRYVLEGSVRKSGRRIRVASQLLNASSGQQIWSDHYDRDLTDIFSVQDEITSSVVGAIEPRLLAAESQRARSRRPDELDAWDEVAGALSHFWRFTSSDSDRAIEALRGAVERHPDYAPAHSMLACALLISSYLGWTPPEHERELATTSAYRAVALDERDPWGHLGLGISALMRRSPDEAVGFFDSALDLNPNFATAVGFVGFTQALSGQTSEALNAFERATRISPHDPFNSFFQAGTAVAHYLDGRFEDAVQSARLAVQFRPEYAGGLRILAASLAKAGRKEEAAQTVATLRKLTPDVSLSSVRQSVPYTANVMDRFIDGLREAGVPE